MFDVITSDKQIQELLRMKEKGEQDFNSAMKNSECQYQLLENTLIFQFLKFSR
ncbi:MAG: hypothetical protein LBS28_02115 [Streptococcaceae bacterium]|jgi:hypothetical protein|nr:hypothetical protein [Streptococcaceae bacterium]